MELKYIVLTIIKIVISVPTLTIVFNSQVDGAALMGGHLDNNKNSSQNFTHSLFLEYDSQEHENIHKSAVNVTQKTPTSTTESLQEKMNTNSSQTKSEEIPDPEPLVVPGYNLPENIFNNGKPFYLEKDPVTGGVNFETKSQSAQLEDDFYDYTDEEVNSDIYDKANIDRKDGSLTGHHRPSDINQLTPNFHDFLNLPVKYNSEKYVYPLISNSYANTKIQGNVNKYYNHKDYNEKPFTKKADNPTYYSSTAKTQNYDYFTRTVATTTKSWSPTSATTTTTTIKPSTSRPVNVMNSDMVHPSFNEEFPDEEEHATGSKVKPNDIYLTTENVNHISLTSKSSTTTKRTMSLFEQLFGDYEEEMASPTTTTTTTTTTERTKVPSLFTNLPSNNRFEMSTTGTYSSPNIVSGSNMALENSYEYEDEYDMPVSDNIAVENKPTTKYLSPSSTTTQKTSENTPSSSVIFAVTTPTTTTSRPVTKGATHLTTSMVTSLPLGDNHIGGLNNNQPIIVATQNLREKLNNEKVMMPRPFGFDKPVQNAPSTSNIHIHPHEDTVSFVVGHQQNVDGGQYVGTMMKESPYDSNPFRPLYGFEATYTNENNYNYSNKDERFSPSQQPSTVTIQPMRNSEASLAIGIPLENIKQKPGQVMDAKLELDQKIEFPNSGASKVVFPDEKEAIVPNQVPPRSEKPEMAQTPMNNREILKLNSRPMYHQLPSDLTPPKEKDNYYPPQHHHRIDRPRPPWDPRPGHFFSGKPEYARPPRPDLSFKRIDNLPNILPHFRPGIKNHNLPHFHDNRLRQPLLERPNNRPIGFFEKLLPPPPPPAKHIHSLRKGIPHNPHVLQSLDARAPFGGEDSVANEPTQKPTSEQFYFHPTPPKVMTNRRNGEEGEVETLQMIQAKQSEQKDTQENVQTQIPISAPGNHTDKPLYVVYPVNTSPIKMDVIDTNKRESVVIGTRAELPLPPSKIQTEFNYEQNPILGIVDRNDSPILKPHAKPPPSPIKSDFPYPLERPDPTFLHPVPELQSNNVNNADESKINDEKFVSNNQWNTVGEENLESRIVNGGKINQISATLKTYSEKPIAVAYTPTEPNEKYDHFDKYSAPNYGSPVIPEIRPGSVENAKLDLDSSKNEITLNAVMHAHHHPDHFHQQPNLSPNIVNHKIDVDAPNIKPEVDFQAPFQASVSVDSMSQGWSVVRDKSKMTNVDDETTVMPLASTSEFDIENFKPKLEGGFKPIYKYPSDETSQENSDREE